MPAGNFITGHQRALAWSIIAAVAIAIVALGLTVATTFSTPCTSCHSRGSFAAQTAKSVHADVDCEKCHTTTLATRTPLHSSLSRAANVRRDAAAVPDSRCLSCHKQVLGGSVVEGKGIRINHAVCATSSSCTDCHSSVAHGTATKWLRSYEMDVCLECHLTRDNFDCGVCHVDNKSIERVRSAFRVTHGARWKSMHGMGDVATCTVCHSSSDCLECHGAGVPHQAAFIEVHSGYASKPNARCATCHPKAFCNDCHGMTMPHPATFKRGHARSAKKDPELCKSCHNSTDCTECHVKHVHPGGAVGLNVLGGGGPK